MNPRKAFEQAICKTAALMMVITKDDVDFVYDPFRNFVQIGMGGEWWTGDIKGTGSYTFHHRKERVDPAYAPVRLKVDGPFGGKLLFEVSGGFGDEAVFVLELK
jgi:hypothetical protein